MKQLKRIVCLLLCIVLAGSAVGVAAEGTSHSYVYDSWENAMSVSEPYTATGFWQGAEAYGGTALNLPTDMYVTADETVYILDAGNNRVVVMDADGTFLREIRFEKDGQPLAFQAAQGLFVTADGTLYVADKDARTVYVADAEGKVTGTVDAPPADKVEDGFEYTPISVVVDTAGIIYVISSSAYNGALQYDENYQYLGYYGSEQVTVTVEVMLRQLWKSVLSEEAAAGLERNVPTSIIRLDIDSNNFIYTLKGGDGSGTGQVRRLNTLGGNILYDDDGEPGMFGDQDTYFDSVNNITVTSSLVDLVADDDGFVTVLDHTYNRLLQYDASAHLLYAFGGSGTSYGNFKSPVALELCGDNILVLDQEYGAVSVLTPTLFAQNVRKGTVLYNEGLYSEAGEYWAQVLKTDAYYELANVGMGAAYEENGDYEKAMEYYKLGNDKSSYSACFAEVRDLWIREHFALLLGGVVVLLLGIVVALNLSEKYRKSDYDIHVTKWKYPLHCIAHPFKAYYELKVDKKGSMLLACLATVLFFFSGVVKEQFTSFHYSTGVKENFNVLLVLGSTVGLLVLFVLCNWAVSTLADGEGKLQEIFIFTNYALITFSVSTIVLTGLSHILTLEESAFMGVLWVIVYGWTAVQLFVATREVHQYTALKTVAMLIGAVVGIYLLLLLITIGYSLLVQLISFITTLYSEFRLR